MCITRFLRIGRLSTFVVFVHGITQIKRFRLLRLETFLALFRSEWYERIENNPWRSVDGRALERRSRFGEANFRYFAKETRKEVKEKQREKRVLKWMLWKLPQDDDVDDLLSWSQALDYDAYIRCLWNAQVLKGFFLVNGTHVAAQEAVQPFLPFRETKKRKGDCKERVRKAGTCNTFPILDLTFKSVCS